ncbi:MULTISPECIES: MurR/RpiR family transcriptional regulator [unclassified Rhizobium]|mgnify:CR=1 FL=1|jgi:DNA-binding MurR/RpiR family transcriptional regulator|uniref:MurR/RpiR family transcriptional regulator n=1 Tax=unclassified Rhizobium TaxID=2613769 RepID=UPI000647720C|nr:MULTISPECIES: MurR/RpiR family transcriptional regulator [unclassified Rhizobium]MBN8951417.1 MurR/RpiR family transcriptional regulator [Rhizobium tropici]OJY74769.1 MAG: transcriptional regulator [Rhizobium sp. 60-20]RKD66720.1 RpiR family transcriptional regulator [Rhizobium sp. WW_1]
MTTDHAADQLTLNERIDAALPSMSPAEQKMASFFRSQKQAVLLNSAAEISAKAGTSDATVVRTARSLGFEGLADLREAILADLTAASPEGRLSRTLEDLGANSEGALGLVLRAHHESLEVMSSATFSEAFARTVKTLFSARRRFVFGIGPSGNVAEYAALQFNRLGLSTAALSDSGIGLADRLIAVEKGDAILMIAHAPVYREVSVVLDYAEAHEVPVLLVGDSLHPYVARQVAEVLPISRGRADHLAMHGATIVLIEAMIVALAAEDRDSALSSLAKFGALRGAIDKHWLKRGVKK